VDIKTAGSVSILSPVGVVFAGLWRYQRIAAIPPEAPLKQDCHIKFMNEGRTELGRVSTVAPGDWYKIRVTPTIHVVLSGGE
jgi:hypothetical protein